MATLSKMVIENIAERMTEKSEKYTESCYKEYQDLVKEFYVSQIPEEVKKCFKNHPDFFDTCTTINMDGHGLNRESITVIGAVISNKGSHYNCDLKLTSAIGDKVVKAKRKWEKAKEEFKELVRETEGALFALKTHKNIRENLPQAIPFLPPPMSNSLVINFDSLKKRLNKQPEIKVVT